MVDPLTSQGYTQALKERVLDKSFLSTCPSAHSLTRSMKTGLKVEAYRASWERNHHMFAIFVLHLAGKETTRGLFLVDIYHGRQ